MKARPCSIPSCGASPARPYPFGWRCAGHAPPEPAGRYCAPRRCYCGECPPPCAAGIHLTADRAWSPDLRRWVLYCTSCGAEVGTIPRPRL